MPNGNILSSSTNYSIKFVCFSDESKNHLQYDFGENSSKIFEVILKNVDKISVHSISKGYYKIGDNSWGKFPRDPGAITSIVDIDSKKSFKAEYLKEIPKYSNESDWPTWLNKKPEFWKNGSKIIDDTDANILNADHIRFKVNQKTWYRTYYKTNDDIEKVGIFMN